MKPGLFWPGLVYHRPYCSPAVGTLIQDQPRRTNTYRKTSSSHLWRTEYVSFSLQNLSSFAGAVAQERFYSSLSSSFLLEWITQLMSACLVMYLIKMLCSVIAVIFLYGTRLTQSNHKPLEPPGTGQELSLPLGSFLTALCLLLS